MTVTNKEFASITCHRVLGLMADQPFRDLTDQFGWAHQLEVKLARTYKGYADALILFVAAKEECVRLLGNIQNKELHRLEWDSPKRSDTIWTSLYSEDKERQQLIAYAAARIAIEPRHDALNAAVRELIEPNGVPGGSWAPKNFMEMAETNRHLYHYNVCCADRLLKLWWEIRRWWYQELIEWPTHRSVIQTVRPASWERPIPLEKSAPSIKRRECEPRGISVNLL